MQLLAWNCKTKQYSTPVKNIQTFVHRILNLIFINLRLRNKEFEIRWKATVGAVDFVKVQNEIDILVKELAVVQNEIKKIN